MVLHSVHLRNKHAARSVSFATCFFVDRDTLMMVAARFPATHKLIRRYAAMLALRRELILRSRIQLAIGSIAKITSSSGETSGSSGGGEEGLKSSSPRDADFARLEAMLWNIQHGVIQASVDPLLGPEAQKAKQTSQISAMEKTIEKQNQVLQGVQSQIEKLVAAVSRLSTDTHRAPAVSSLTTTSPSHAASVTLRPAPTPLARVASLSTPTAAHRRGTALAEHGTTPAPNAVDSSDSGRASPNFGKDPEREA